MDSGTPSRKSRLKHFIHDGVWASICEGFAESNFNAFSTALSASPQDLGTLFSSQNLVGCWLQLWSERLIAVFRSRRRFVVLCVSLQAFILALMVAHTFVGKEVWLFMILTLLFTVVGSFSGSIWSSWMSDLLPSTRRGFCFGIRNKFTYSAQFLALMSGGLLLQVIQRTSSNFRGTQMAFCTVFFIGLIAKLLSLYHLYSQPEIRFVVPNSTLGPLKLLFNGYQNYASKKIILFFGLLGLSLHVAAPFQTPYLLQNLQYGYLMFASTAATPVIARFISAPIFGRIVDRLGYEKPFLISTILMPCITLCWSLSKSYLVILFSQLMSGFIWTAFDLATFCLLAEYSDPSTSHRIFSLKQISWSLFSALGALLGGIIIHRYNNPTLLFWLSTIMRFAVGLLAFFLFGNLHHSKIVSLAESDR